MPPFSLTEILCYFSWGKYCANMSGRTNPQPTPQAAKRKRRKNGKKGEKVGLEKPAGMGLEGFLDWVNQTFR